jgi:hypothetical protein
MAREDREEQIVLGECDDYKKAGFPYKRVVEQIASMLKIGPEDVEKLIKKGIIDCQEMVEDDNFCVECFMDNDVVEHVEDYLKEIEEE